VGRLTLSSPQTTSNLLKNSFSSYKTESNTSLHSFLNSLKWLVPYAPALLNTDDGEDEIAEDQVLGEKKTALILAAVMSALQRILVHTEEVRILLLLLQQEDRLLLVVAGNRGIIIRVRIIAHTTVHKLSTSSARIHRNDLPILADLLALIDTF